MIIDIVLGLALGKGGLEQVLTAISQALQSKDHDVRLFQMMPSPHKEWEQTLPRVYYYDYARMQYGNTYDGEIEPYRFALGYRTLLDTIGIPDLILATHTPMFSFVTRLATGYLGNHRPPIISWIHGPTAAYGGGQLLKFADAHFAISESVEQDIKNCLPGNAPIYTIGNPVAIENLNRIPRPKGTMKLIFIGRIENSQKRIDVLMHALSALHGVWELHLFGEGPDQTMLEELARNLSISDHLFWHGWVNNPWDAIETASALVLTSDYEGFGLVLVEALARGIPVIGTNCAGPQDIIQEGTNGWLFPVGDTNKLTEIVQDIIDNKLVLPDPEVCEQSVRQYQIDIVVKKIERGMITTKAFYTP